MLLVALGDELPTDLDRIKILSFKCPNLHDYVQISMRNQHLDQGKKLMKHCFIITVLKYMSKQVQTVDHTAFPRSSVRQRHHGRPCPPGYYQLDSTSFASLEMASTHRHTQFFAPQEVGRCALSTTSIFHRPLSWFQTSS